MEHLPVDVGNRDVLRLESLDGRGNNGSRISKCGTGDLMATVQLPTFRALPDHKYNIVLDSETFIFEFHLNARANRWSVNIFDVEDVPVRHGIRLIEGTDLLQRIALASRPPGQLIVVDLTGAGIEPDADTLGVDVSLRYVEAS